MSFFIFVKIVHIITAIFFISVVSFRTFIIPSVKKAYGKEIYLKVQKVTGEKARGIIKINNIFLILSGSYLFSFYLTGYGSLVHIKVTLGLLLAITFYLVPFIMDKFNHISWFSTSFHHLFFTLMILTVILSQVMFH